jgi:ferric-dicitrate binding protein FerR (iron transport regulator)
MEDRSERDAIAWRDRLERDRSQATLAAFEAWRADPANAHAFEQQTRLGERLPESAFKAERPRRAGRERTGTWSPSPRRRRRASC